MKSIYATIALITDCIEVIIDYLIIQSFISIIYDRLITPAAKIND